MRQQQETLYFKYANLGSHVQFQIVCEKSLVRVGALVAPISSGHGLLCLLSFHVSEVCIHFSELYYQ